MKNSSTPLKGDNGLTTLKNVSYSPFKTMYETNNNYTSTLKKSDYYTI